MSGTRPGYSKLQRHETVGVSHPAGLTDDDLDRLNDVRKQTWKGGYAGFAVGGVWGLGNCFLFKRVQQKAVEQFPDHPVIKALPRLQNKHFVMWTLVAGATGMFMGAAIEGMRGSESLRDIYERRAKEAGEVGGRVEFSPHIFN